MAPVTLVDAATIAVDFSTFIDAEVTLGLAILNKWSANLSHAM
jgi:hypothetical protein